MHYQQLEIYEETIQTLKHYAESSTAESERQCLSAAIAIEQEIEKFKQLYEKESIEIKNMVTTTLHDLIVKDKQAKCECNDLRVKLSFKLGNEEMIKQGLILGNTSTEEVRRYRRDNAEEIRALKKKFMSKHEEHEKDTALDKEFQKFYTKVDKLREIPQELGKSVKSILDKLLIGDEVSYY